MEFDPSFFIDTVAKGIDAKLLQYDTKNIVKCFDTINITNVLNTYFNKNTDKIFNNACVINILKDKYRYDSVVDELKKISIYNFMHIKATYWKERKKFESDMTLILKFLRQFNENVNDNAISIDIFSDINNKDIYIQDGPLACYCSHLRAMMYGYLNFEDYTIVIEDDIDIVNTENIETYLKMIPNDWHVICMNAIPKNRTYDGEFYKFTDHFHSTHFYIIRNSCMPKIFENMYPIYDQVDVLLSNMINEINIYNIPNTIFQKTLSTNTQNNLHCIFNSPNYEVVREQINNVSNHINYFIDIILSSIDDNNKKQLNYYLMYDVIYNNITGQSNNSEQNEEIVYDIYDTERFQSLCKSIGFIIQCSVKGINVKNISIGHAKQIIKILYGFELHNTIDIKYNKKIYALTYGASSHVYISEDMKYIIKKYDKKMRWTYNNMTTNDMFLNEIEMLKNTDILLEYDIDEMKIWMNYEGESLYDNFRLNEIDDWKEQITKIFSEMDMNKIYYPEFRLHNILIKNNKIKFADYGLARVLTDETNEINCKNFIEILEILGSKFLENDQYRRYELYHTFLNNVKIHKSKDYEKNIF